MKAGEIWQLGDYSTVGARWARAGDRLVADTVAPGDRVLDVACGPGGMAVTAARHGASVTAVDVSPTLLDVARAHAARHDVGVTWLEHDMTAMPFRDASFDVVLSAFGAMFAPDPVAMGGELCRLCAPGGTVAVLAWTPDSVFGRFGPMAGSRMPPGGDRPAIEEWGRPESVRRFLPASWTVETRELGVDVRWPTRAQATAELTGLVPGWVLVKAALAPEDWRDLVAEVDALMAEQGTEDADGYTVRAGYLETRASPPA
ncbi:methyltransferase family protein [Stackebrandtia albiflava]|uniref:Methyltransferase family protein n=1 Tax=Stackebrandtia albiflava TaxID=406432 RepID=A0A562UQ37_9ACTN|nr:class I SAM-dependent methyltransferase [Stackebrandtia albiflava]TWJ07728.1 methyltransferase family protein [Stackebrandtia albiflava]